MTGNLRACIIKAYNAFPIYEDLLLFYFFLTLYLLLKVTESENIIFVPAITINSTNNCYKQETQHNFGDILITTIFDTFSNHASDRANDQFTLYRYL